MYIFTSNLSTLNIVSVALAFYVDFQHSNVDERNERTAVAPFAFKIGFCAKIDTLASPQPYH